MSEGQASDFTQAEALLQGFKPKCVLADKGYDGESVLNFAASLGATPVIPPKSNRKNPRNYDKIIYKERNQVERLFQKLKHFRRIATRYDKTASAFLGFIHLAAICLWIH